MSIKIEFVTIYCNTLYYNIHILVMSIFFQGRDCLRATKGPRCIEVMAACETAHCWAWCLAFLDALATPDVVSFSTAISACGKALGLDWKLERAGGFKVFWKVGKSSN